MSYRLSMDSGLQGRVALVTGASGGIGWALADALAREGCLLALHAHRHAALLRRRLKERKLLARSLVVRADVRKEVEVEAAFRAAADRFGRIDLCVASAGMWPPESRLLHEMPSSRIRDVIATNLLGTIWTTRAFLRQVAARRVKASSLVLIGSTAGRFGEAGHAEYAVSKAGLRGLMLSYKNEVVRVDPEGRCNLVEPGWTLTPMTESSLDDERAVAKALRTRSLRTIARLPDVVAAVLYFASPRLSGHVTGQTLTVAGGMEGRLLWDEEEVDLAAVREGSERCRRSHVQRRAG